MYSVWWGRKEYLTVLATNCSRKMKEGKKTNKKELPEQVSEALGY